MSDEKKTPRPRTRKAPRRTRRDGEGAAPSELERPAAPPPARKARGRPPGSAPTPKAPEVPPAAPGEEPPSAPPGRRKASAAGSPPRAAAQRPETTASASASEAASSAVPPDGGQPSSSGGSVLPVSRLTDEDLYLFGEGRHFRLWEKLGAHPGEAEGVAGTHFAVWAPSAREVSVVGDWNGWTPGEHRLSPRDVSGIWEGFLPGVGKGALYKYHLRSHHGGYEVAKADPFAFRSERPPATASIVWELDYAWGDDEWMGRRGAAQSLEAPASVYEIHPGSWRRGEGGRHLGWRELAPRLADHLEACGFTHAELLPVMEHPYYGSWGYQTTGYFAPTSRYGEPQDFMAFVDHLHGRGIGVILDWVPSHFPTDEHSLGYFDGTHLFEHADPRRGFHPDWSSFIFDYGRNEVRSFLVSSALFWLDRYHADGFRVDAVASMLYLDYSRKEGEWIPNEHGGRENLEAVRFLKELNEEVYRRHPDVQMVAEESTAWPSVSRPTSGGGLGFGYKWDMGWMHDTLAYLREDPVHRKDHHDKLTFRRLYAYAENFVLPLSHDEVVHGKGSLLGKMPGDEWQRFANLRLLLANMTAQPGKKLLFMGAELAQLREWAHESQLDWHLVEAGEGGDLPAEGRHAGVLRLVGDLNRLYRDEPALHRLDVSPEGFEWLDADDREHSTLSFLRRAVPAGDAGEAEAPPVVAVFNFTPVPRENFRLGVPSGGRWREMLNTDAEVYGGSGVGNFGGVESHPVPRHGQRRSVTLTLPPLGALFLRGGGK